MPCKPKKRHEPEDIYMLEILVGKIHIFSGHPQTLSVNLPRAETLRVIALFLQYSPLEICEDITEPRYFASTEADINVSGGKSMVFSMNSEDLWEALDKTEKPLTLHVYNRGDYCFGDVEMCFKDIAQEVVTQIIEGCSNECIVTRKTKGSFKILDTVNKQAIGTVNIFIRFTGYGRAVFTKFQGAGQVASSYVYQNADDKEKYECVPHNDRSNVFQLMSRAVKNLSQVPSPTSSQIDFIQDWERDEYNRRHDIQKELNRCLKPDDDEDEAAPVGAKEGKVAEKEAADDVEVVLPAEEEAVEGEEEGERENMEMEAIEEVDEGPEGEDGEPAPPPDEEEGDAAEPADEAGGDDAE